MGEIQRIILFPVNVYINSKITNIDDQNGKFKISITNDKETREQTTNYGVKLRVKVGDEVKPGDMLNEGSINPKELLAVTDPITVQSYIGFCHLIVHIPPDSFGPASVWKYCNKSAAHCG